MEKILVIDDDNDICALLQRFLTRKGYEVIVAHSGATGIESVRQNAPDLVITDFRLGDMDGYDILKNILEGAPHLPVLVMTGYSDIRTAVNVIQHGALDYIAKPILPDEILLSIRKALDNAPARRPALAAEIPAQPARNEPAPAAEARKKGSTQAAKPGTHPAAYVVGQSLAAQNLYRQIDLVAPTNFSVIIYGESGAGKESVARLIHERSTRRNQPFISMDCGAISKDLANSELFGHEKGAFTGALGAKQGHFEMANGGTLFFDEIANLPYDVQVSLLRVVQERKLKRIGGTKEIPVDVRIIVASNERLMVACRKGKFREDLYHRFNEFSIDLPPLRARKDDIMLFANRFLQETAAELGRFVQGFSPEVEQVLLQYPWYGNVRELKNMIKRATLLTDGPWVQIQSLPFEIAFFDRLGIDEPEAAERAPAPVEFQQAPAHTERPGTLHTPPPPTALQFIPEHTDLKSAAQAAEYQRIIQALQQVRYNKSKAAELLGIDRKTLYNKLKAYNIT
ncbi:MAG: sigma-54 dependent transcriptional regulator [Saprospiraceae bacterium]